MKIKGNLAEGETYFPCSSLIEIIRAAGQLAILYSGPGERA
jgi:hypothetical protein